ncbi:MAG: DUF5658 family protein [bacterium]
MIGLISGLIVFIIGMVNCSEVYSQEITKSVEMERGSIVQSTEIKEQISGKKLKRKDWFYTGLEINYVMLNALDLISTFYVLEKGAKEANPIARLYIKNKPLAVLIKGSVTAGVLYGLTHVKCEDNKVAYITLGLLNIFYGFVVQNNIGVYLQFRK